MRKLTLYILSGLLIIASTLTAQTDTTAIHKPHYRHASVMLAGASFQLQYPTGNISEYFGIDQNIGFTATYLHKSDLFVETEFNYIFGRNLTDKANAIFDGITDSKGMIINENGEYSDYLLMERGFWLGGKIGYIIHPLKKYPQLGILMKVGAGILEYKIRISNDGNNTPQINGEYVKGYDHLTNGFSTSQTLGLSYLTISDAVNFFIGVEATQAWTYNRRAFNFNEGSADTQQHFDALWGLKVGWFIAIYRRNASDYLYF